MFAEANIVHIHMTWIEKYFILWFQSILAESMLIMATIIHYGKSGLPSKVREMNRNAWTEDLTSGEKKESFWINHLVLQGIYYSKNVSCHKVYDL